MMTRLSLALLFLTGTIHGQSHVPWGQITDIPALAAQSENTLFYVSSYTSVYTHTAVHMDYDLARRDADAFLKAHPHTPTYLVLNPAPTQTCDDVPLPTVARGDGSLATLSIVGYGSGLSYIQKRPGCNPTAATLSFAQATNGAIENATFQGFSIDANHIDASGCEFHGISQSTFFDIACGNARPEADHEMEFGNAAEATEGQDSSLRLYNLKAFDSVGAGKGAVLTPMWQNGSLAGVTLVNEGTKAYSHQFSRVQVVGPGLVTCSIVPTLTPTLSTTNQAVFPVISTVIYGFITGATIVNAGKCGDTTQLYLLIQDGVPVMTGMKFSNMTQSQVWNLEPTGSMNFGEAWMPLSGNNSIIGEHPYTNQTVQIADYASGNRHINTYFDSPGVYGAALYGPTGSFTNAVFSWDGASYSGSSGYLLNDSNGGASEWRIANSQCTDSSTRFVAVTTSHGPLTNGDTPPANNVLEDIEICDGSNAVAWPTPVIPISQP